VPGPKSRQPPGVVDEAVGERVKRRLEKARNVRAAAACEESDMLREEMARVEGEIDDRIASLYRLE